MSILEPTKLETLSHRQQGWNAILSANMQRTNDLFKKIWGLIASSVVLGEGIISGVDGEDIEGAPEPSIQEMTDSSNGTAAIEVIEVAGTGDDVNINNNMASIVAQLNESKSTCDELQTKLNETIDQNNDMRNKINELLAALRTTTGCGVFAE